MKEITLENRRAESGLSFLETKIGDTVKFVCKAGEKEIGHISASQLKGNIYNVSGLYVNPSALKEGIDSRLVKFVNVFLQKKKAIGKIVDGDESAQVYENNRWTKGEFKSQDAYRGYEYTYDGTKGLEL